MNSYCVYLLDPHFGLPVVEADSYVSHDTAHGSLKVKFYVNDAVVAEFCNVMGVVNHGEPVDA